MSDAIRATPLFDLRLDAPPAGRRYDTGTETGTRRWIGIAMNGRFEGPELRGNVLPGGGDWAILRSDRQVTIDGRLTMETDDGAIILMRYGGRFVIPPEVASISATDAEKQIQLDASQYYWRITPEFETGFSRYGWLNDIVSVGFGARQSGGIGYRILRVL
jgi:hypothetical protein